jgi:hypothetical protein
LVWFLALLAVCGTAVAIYALSIVKKAIFDLSEVPTNRLARLFGTRLIERMIKSRRRASGSHK